MSRICVVGLWHQASVVSACFADMGHQVCGVGDDPAVVAALNSGEPPVHEPKLKGILRRNLNSKRLAYTTDYQKALDGADFVFVSIDTPVGLDDRADLSSVYDVSKKIAQVLSRHICVVVTAQVPVGTCEHIAEIMAREDSKARFDVAYVPEFLRLGTAVDTFRKADRFIIGANDTAVARRVAALYEPLGRPVMLTNLRTAEMAKHASNTFLALSISFINEIADLCDAVGADALSVAQAMKMDRRIGEYAFLSPGLGFAGGTLGRDVRAIQAFGQENGIETHLMNAVMTVNQSRANLVRQRLQKIYDSLEGLQIGIWGLTYKPGTSTLRRSIALDIIRDMVEQQVAVKAFDPLARLDEVSDLPEFQFCPDAYAAVEKCDAVVLVTEWSDIQNVVFSRVRRLMRRPVFIDTRNLFDPEEMQKNGFIYSGVGRGIHSGGIV